MKKIFLILLFISTIFSSCYKLDLSHAEYGFNDGAENLFNYDSTFFADGNWTTFQLTKPENTISIDTTIVHSGNHAYRFFALKGDDVVSKSSLIRSNNYFKQNDVIDFSAFYFLIGTRKNLFLVDMEENAPISSSPGVRIMLGDTGFLCLNRGKLGLHTINQPYNNRKIFPTGCWVKLSFEIKLSRQANGYFKLWQNDNLLIDEKKIITLDKDVLYFVEGTRGIYNNLEIGITANGQTSSTILYVDDIEIKKVN